MFTNSYVAWLACQERSKERLREAEQYGLVRQVLRARRRQGRFYCRALIWFGQRLVDWGRHLQEGRDVVIDSSLLRAVNQSQ